LEWVIPSEMSATVCRNRYKYETAHTGHRHNLDCPTGAKGIETSDMDIYRRGNRETALMGINGIVKNDED
jgi:hypothetical protein